MYDTSNSSLVIPLVKIEKATDKTLSIFFKTDIDLSQDIGQLLEPIEGTFTLEIKQKVLLCSGAFEAKLTLKCDRCLKDYTITQDLQINEALEIVDVIELLEEVELQMQDAHEQITIDDSIDLVDLLRQHIILNLPYKKVCSENCYNEDLKTLNETNKKNIDPRWEKLKQLSESWESN